jgi:hypothetical protein
MEIVTETLDSLSQAHPTTFLNLTVFPLFRKCDYVRNYRPLRESIAAGSASVREVSKSGSVPELLVENHGKEPVLILEGEELIGAKQNRTANVTVLVPAGKTVRIPVTCVESGRWAYQTRAFASSEQVHFARGRVNKMASVSESMKHSGSRRANQQAVWDDIAQKTSRMRVSAPTGAMTDVFDAHRTRLEDYVGAFQTKPDQLGALFAIGDRIEGFELFDCSETFTEMLPKLIRSYAIDAIEDLRSHRRNPTEGDAETFLGLLRKAQFETYPAVGEGTEVRLTQPGLIGAGLVAEGRVVHLAAFSAPHSTEREELDSHGFARMRTRRRGMRR